MLSSIFGRFLSCVLSIVRAFRMLGPEGIAVSPSGLVYVARMVRLVSAVSSFYRVYLVKV